MLTFDSQVEVGEIREWLKPRGYSGEYHKFIVIEKFYSEYNQEFVVKLLYPNGFIDELFESDLLKTNDDEEEDWEYSVKIEDAEIHYEAIRKDSNSVLQG
jgi:hypothetical protein